MIAFLKGVMLDRHPSGIVVDVHGVGYALQVPVSTYARLPALGAEVALHIYTQVRDDAIQLFGFAARAEKQVFERLITVNGVGPKLALSILSGLPVEALGEAIRRADHARLTAIPGVGRKTAERLVIELRDKMPESAALAPAPTSAGPAEDVVSALVNLGYPAAVAEKAVQRVLQTEAAAGFDDLFLKCMKAL